MLSARWWVLSGTIASLCETRREEKHMLWITHGSHGCGRQEHPLKEKQSSEEEEKDVGGMGLRGGEEGAQGAKMGPGDLRIRKGKSQVQTCMYWSS